MLTYLALREVVKTTGFMDKRGISSKLKDKNPRKGVA
jgi:hypothetical protein